ncbi:hypothetical protein TraAM80_05780 [Trypanosoma rangeli]|uniref:Uncharacterized protein n=1 Tax=Trypanosoma rangeli TaxID=5698 RepID=A0A422NDX5_TRYRA|nr:uncharacterized protein TraAM80_05780 [Trypanosoma rangeli]RNF03681.1 hypothetical protein TraAM80_05780 [Trypanosoma rangeli]|eukprot:RNF03681.1 hypothetical protein TraAM80_05780 [Trypanosoma rangeli]
MSADRILSGSGGTPSLELQIDGAPLAGILVDMMRLIRSQQDELAALRRNAEEGICRGECSLKQHEEVLSRLSEDVQLHVRPIHHHAQPPMPTMADAVANVECRLGRIERARKLELAARLREVTAKNFTATFYNQWLQHRTRRVASYSLLVQTKKNVWQRYMRRWFRYLSFRMRQLARRRHFTGLIAAQERRLMRRYWCQWTQLAASKLQTRVHWRISSHNAAEMMLHLTCRSIARRYLRAWVQFSEATRNAKNRATAALLLEQKAARLLAERYIQKWLDAHRWRQLFVMRLKKLDALRVKTCRNLVRSHFRTWHAIIQHRRERYRTLRLIPHLHHTSLAALARRYFSRLYAFRLVRREARVVEALEQRLQTLSERADGLQRQLDMGLHTLSHTNSVLARVVDTVMISREPRAALHTLLQDETILNFMAVPSVGETQNHQEASSSPVTAQPHCYGDSAPAAGPERQSKDEHHCSSASEVLESLRARLENTYKVARNEA